MNTLWIAAALIAGLILLAILLPTEPAHTSRVFPPADTLPDKPIPEEQEHREQEDTTCGT